MKNVGHLDTSDQQTIDYNNDVDITDIEMVDFNNDTQINNLDDNITVGLDDNIAVTCDIDKANWKRTSKAQITAKKLLESIRK